MPGEILTFIFLFVSVDSFGKTVRDLSKLHYCKYGRKPMVLPCIFFSCHERCSYCKHRLEYPQSQHLSLHTRTFPQILSFTSCSSRNNAKGSRFFQSNVLEFSLIHTKLALISLKLRHRLHLVSQETISL